MGGKKKGGLANRLARMSDDERAKYLQRKADMEEEVRRRKEQLVVHFMKNKLKKEDAFSRLNVAKINQYWHSIMRAQKCEDMKRDVEHLRKWINRTVTAKNRTIKKLMEELDRQEELYGKNFKTHSEHIDKIIEFHNRNLEQLCEQYEDDKRLLLHIGTMERANFEKGSEETIEHLKTIAYRQEVEFNAHEKQQHETYVKKIDEILTAYKTELKQMQKDRDKLSCALWRQISKLLRAYVRQTDVRRFHLAELQRLDLEGALEISKNQQHILKEEEDIKKLRDEYETLIEVRDEQIKNLESVLSLTTKRFFHARKALNSEVSRDDKRLAHLADVSNDVIKHLRKLAVKGEQMRTLAETCQKLEGDGERIKKWTSLTDLNKECDAILEKEGGTTMVARLPFEQIAEEQSITFTKKSLSLRPTKSSLVSQAKLSATTLKNFLPPLVGEQYLKRTKSAPKLLDPSSIKTGFESLNKLEGLWWIYNKVKMDCVTMKQEKRRLIEQNNKLKEIIREILAATALGQNVSSASVGTDTSTRRTLASAPGPWPSRSIV